MPPETQLHNVSYEMLFCRGDVACASFAVCISDNRTSELWRQAMSPILILTARAANVIAPQHLNRIGLFKNALMFFFVSILKYFSSLFRFLCGVSPKIWICEPRKDYWKISWYEHLMTWRRRNKYVQNLEWIRCGVSSSEWKKQVCSPCPLLNRVSEETFRRNFFFWQFSWSSVKYLPCKGVFYMKSIQTTR